MQVVWPMAHQAFTILDGVLWSTVGAEKSVLRTLHDAGSSAEDDVASTAGQPA
jgi:hypothetical protein